MATNIVKEDNLVKVIRNKSVTTRNPERLEDILSKYYFSQTVVFKDFEGVYPEGKVVHSEEGGVNFRYEYKKDGEGNIVYCIVYAEPYDKKGRSKEVGTTTIVYDRNGHVIEKNHYHDNIIWLRERYEYYSNGNLARLKIKNTTTITTKEYDVNGRIVYIWDKTISSGAIHKKYLAKYNKDGDPERIVDFDTNKDTHIFYDKNHEGKIIHVTEEIRECFNGRTVGKKVTSYAAETDYQQLSTVFNNGILVEKHTYDMNGELIQMLLREDDREVLTRISKTIDEETGYIVEERTNTITKYGDGVPITVVVRFVYDGDKLMTYSEDNSKVTTYTYDEQGRRSTATTKQLIGEDFVVISEITYTYNTDSETGKETATRTEIRFDKDGNKVSQDTRTESISDAETEHTSEFKKYEV